MKNGKWTAGVTVCAVILALTALPAATRAAGHEQNALKALEGANLTLAKAVEAAETFSKGRAIATHVKPEAQGGSVIVLCEVTGKCMEVPVDLKTGKATKMSEAPAKEEKADHVAKSKEIAKQLDDAKMTLAKAIDAAELGSKGKAVAVRPKLASDKLELTVTTVAGDKVFHVTVNGKTGKVEKTEEAKPIEKKHENKKPAEKKPGAPVKP